MTEDKMVAWHHRLNGHGFGWIPGAGDGQGGLAWCDLWGHRVGHDWASELNWIPWLLQLHWPSKLPLYSPMTMVTTPCPQNSTLKPALFRPQRLLFSSHAFLFPWLIFSLWKFTISLIFLFSPHLLACFWHLLLFLKYLLIRILNFSASCHSIPSTS